MSRRSSGNVRQGGQGDLSPRLSRLVLYAAGLFLTSLPAAALAGPLPHLGPADALIENTGSTNTASYKIYLSPNGYAQYGVMHGPMQDFDGSGYKSATLPKAQTKRLFQDLTAALPFKTLPARHGMRSTSFGTRTYVTYEDQRSPDLTLGGDPRMNALKADVTAIAQVLHVADAPRRPVPARRPMVLHLNGTNKP